MITTLPDSTSWAHLNTKEEKELFILSFRDSNEQLRLVMQYYEFKWDDITFGMSEHTWLKYIGAYKNLIFKDEIDLTGEEFIDFFKGRFNDNLNSNMWSAILWDSNTEKVFYMTPNLHLKTIEYVQEHLKLFLSSYAVIKKTGAVF